MFIFLHYFVLLILNYVMYAIIPEVTQSFKCLNIKFYFHKLSLDLTAFKLILI